MEMAAILRRPRGQYEREFALIGKLCKDRARLNRLQGMLGKPETSFCKEDRIRKALVRIEARIQKRSEQLNTAITGKEEEMELEAKKMRAVSPLSEDLSGFALLIGILSAAVGVITLPSQSIIRVIDYSHPVVSFVAWCSCAANTASFWFFCKLTEKRAAFYESVGEMVRHAKNCARSKELFHEFRDVDV